MPRSILPLFFSLLIPNALPRAQGIINATGPYADAILSLDNPSHRPIVRPSSGVHITLPAYYAPARMGLLDPATSDGRVIFFLPWEGGVVAGTTDTPAKVNAQGEEVTPSEEDVRWVIDEVRGYLSPDIKVRRGDVLSAWSGLRPLISAGSEGGTEGLVRNHLVRVDPSGLITIAGGKWTTYRAMAEETVDRAVNVFGLGDKVTRGCRTAELRLVGSDGWSRNMFIGLVQRVRLVGPPSVAALPSLMLSRPPQFGLDTDVAKQLSENYGDRAWTVCALSEPTGEQWPVHGVRLSSTYPYVEAEVLYATRHEYACTAVDVLARRTRLAFVDAQAALAALPRVIDIMSTELGWSRKRQREEYARGVQFLGSMGLAPGSGLSSSVNPLGGWGWGGVWSWMTSSLVAAGSIIIRPTAASSSSSPSPSSSFKPSYSRAKFEAGEVDALRELFNRHASSSDSSSTGSTLPQTQPAHAHARLNKAAIRPALETFAREWPGAGYEGFREADYRYVFVQEGLDDRHRTDVDVDEFIEVSWVHSHLRATDALCGQICGQLKDVSMVSVAKVAKKERKRIPVEKSGGGV